MKDRPILFSGAMVRAILEGRKSQTRRMVTPQPSVGDGGCWYPEPPRKPARRARHYANETHLRNGLPIDFCPYGQPGDRLWVRETWGLVRWLQDWETGIADDVRDWKGQVPSTRPELAWSVVYAASYAGDVEMRKERGFRWRPSIHMPRWASRLTLEVTEVRVQRIQEISEEDARAEGIAPNPVHPGTWMDYPEGKSAAGWRDPRESFRSLWDSINGKRPGCAWEANSFVWAISFRRLP